MKGSFYNCIDPFHLAIGFWENICRQPSLYSLPPCEISGVWDVYRQDDAFLVSVFFGLRHSPWWLSTHDWLLYYITSLWVCSRMSKQTKIFGRRICCLGAHACWLCVWRIGLQGLLHQRCLCRVPVVTSWIICVWPPKWRWSYSTSVVWLMKVMEMSFQFRSRIRSRFNSL